MARSFAVSALLGLLTAPAIAQTPPATTPPGPAIPAPAPRARGPALDVAVDMARAAVAACAAKGYKTSALVADSAGLPVVLLSGDGAMARTQVIAPTKVAMVLKYREPSGATLLRSQSDPALAAALAADPKIGVGRPGALPIMIGDAMIGVISISGSPSGDADAACAQAGIDKVKGRLG